MKDFIKDVLVPVGTLVTALLAGWVNYTVSHVNSALSAQKVQLEAQQTSLNKLTTERNLKKFDEDLTFRIYDAVTVSLKGDAKQQQAASALVIVMAAEPLRTQLLQLFNQSPTTAPEVRTEVTKVLQTEERFRREEAVVKPAAAEKPSAPATTSGWGDWDVDVFWCETSGESAQEQAKMIVAELQKEGAKGRLRARVIPESINARPGYRVHGFMIRRDPGEEERAAALQQLAERVLPGASFEVSASGSATRWYLSAFVCP